MLSGFTYFINIFFLIIQVVKYRHLLYHVSLDTMVDLLLVF